MLMASSLLRQNFSAVGSYRVKECFYGVLIAIIHSKVDGSFSVEVRAKSLNQVEHAADKTLRLGMFYQRLK